MGYRTTREIIIPAGTEVTEDPPHSGRAYTASALILISITEDSTASWTMDMEEALASGLVKEDEPIAEDAPDVTEEEADGELDQESDQEAGTTAP